MEGNIFDYLEWRGDLSFSKDAPNPIDALIFSCLTYINYPGIEAGEKTLYSAWKDWTSLPDGEKFRGIEMMRSSCLQLAEAAAKCRRFRDVKVTRYVESSCDKTEKQFSAMTFLLPGRIAFIAYRGTDNTLVGWKEDFNMAFASGTPAQMAATEYAAGIAEDFPFHNLQLCGHSKGGNLAVWAAVHLPAELKKRVLFVYNNDGPGFIDDITQKPEYTEIGNRILSFVPESSVVGVLMGGCDYLTIKSSAVSLLQHHPFTWKIVGKRFAYETERSFSGKQADKILNNIIRTMDPEEVSALVDGIYEELRSDDAKTLTDLRKHTLRHIASVISHFSKFRANAKRKKELMDAIEDA